MSLSHTETELPIEVTLRGNVGGGAAGYARSSLNRALDSLPVRRIHVVLDWHDHPAMQRPAQVEASLVLDTRRRRCIYAQAEAPTMAEAVDEVADRLRRLLITDRDRVRTQHRH